MAPETLSLTLVLRRGAGAAAVRRVPQPDRFVVRGVVVVVVVCVLRERPPVRRDIMVGLLVVVVCLVVRGARVVRVVRVERLPNILKWLVPVCLSWY